MATASGPQAAQDPRMSLKNILHNGDAIVSLPSPIVAGPISDRSGPMYDGHQHHHHALPGVSGRNLVHPEHFRRPSVASSSGSSIGRSSGSSSNGGDPRTPTTTMMTSATTATKNSNYPPFSFSSSSRTSSKTPSPTISAASTDELVWQFRPSNNTTNNSNSYSLSSRTGLPPPAAAASSSSSSSSPSNNERKPRAPRPSYSEEQKFFIMFARILRDQTWPEIEDDFSRIFNERTKGGLTSIYYRVRKDWGLCEVLKSGPQTIADDHEAVRTRAANFSREFLLQIGWFEGFVRTC